MKPNIHTESLGTELVEMTKEDLIDIQKFIEEKLRELDSDVDFDTYIQNEQKLDKKPKKSDLDSKLHIIRPMTFYLHKRLISEKNFKKFYNEATKKMINTLENHETRNRGREHYYDGFIKYLSENINHVNFQESYDRLKVVSRQAFRCHLEDIIDDILVSYSKKADDSKVNKYAFVRVTEDMVSDYMKCIISKQVNNVIIDSIKYNCCTVKAENGAEYIIHPDNIVYTTTVNIHKLTPHNTAIIDSELDVIAKINFRTGIISTESGRTYDIDLLRPEDLVYDFKDVLRKEDNDLIISRQYEYNNIKRDVILFKLSIKDNLFMTIGDIIKKYEYDKIEKTKEGNTLSINTLSFDYDADNIYSELLMSQAAHYAEMEKDERELLNSALYKMHST